MTVFIDLIVGMAVFAIWFLLGMFIDEYFLKNSKFEGYLSSCASAVTLIALVLLGKWFIGILIFLPASIVTILIFRSFK